jgi:hypothetical protein
MNAVGSLDEYVAVVEVLGMHFLWGLTFGNCFVLLR